MPKVSKIIIVINVAVFAIILFITEMDSSINSNLFMRKIYLIWGLVPKLFYSGYYWQPLTSMFMHGSFMHLLFNMVALYSLGFSIEKMLGSKRFLQLYFISGFTGALLVIIFQADSIMATVGASGAIVGILGALAVFYPNSKLLVFFIPMKAKTAAILIAIGSIAFAIFDESSNISHLGHLGGLIGGVMFSRYIFKLAWNNTLAEQELEADYTIDEANAPKRKVIYIDPDTGEVIE